MQLSDKLKNNFPESSVTFRKQGFSFRKVRGGHETELGPNSKFVIPITKNDRDCTVDQFYV